MYVCHVQMSHVNMGETPRGLLSLQPGPGWSRPWHWSFPLPPWPLPSLLPYLHIALQSIGPVFNSFLKGHYGILRSQLCKKRTSGL